MTKPQQPERARGGHTDVNPDQAGANLESQLPLPSTGKTGPVPRANQPGHHPAKEQDKPDLDAFAAKLGIDNGAGREDDREECASEPPVATGTPAARSSGWLVAGLWSVSAVGLVALSRRRRNRVKAASAAS